MTTRGAARASQRSRPVLTKIQALEARVNDAGAAGSLLGAVAQTERLP